MTQQTKNLVEVLREFILEFLSSFGKKKRSSVLPKISTDTISVEDKELSEELPKQRIKTPEELEGEQILALLKQCQINPALGETTKLLRKFINYEFKFLNEPNFDKTQLQCTEYAHFRVKQKLGIIIKWPSDRPRDGKYWAGIFARNNLYKVSENPAQNCTMSFTDGFKTPLMQQTGHVAFVEEVFPDNSIRISEANWDNKGSYKERTLTEEEWRNHWKGKFVNFS